MQRADPLSDYDLYVYSRTPVPLKFVKRSFPAALAATNSITHFGNSKMIGPNQTVQSSMQCTDHARKPKRKSSGVLDGMWLPSDIRPHGVIV